MTSEFHRTNEPMLMDGGRIPRSLNRQTWRADEWRRAATSWTSIRVGGTADASGTADARGTRTKGVTLRGIGIGRRHGVVPLRVDYHLDTLSRSVSFKKCSLLD